MIGFHTKAGEDAYREQTDRLTQSTPGLFAYTFACKKCGQRKSSREGRKQVVPGAPKFGFLCLECHAKRGEK